MTTPRIVIRDGMPFTEDPRGAHRSTVSELVAEIERLRTTVEALTDAVPMLRLFARNCPGCEGAGVVVCGYNDEDSYEEQCTQCKDLWALIERIEPPKPPAAPAPPLEELEDDIAF